MIEVQDLTKWYGSRLAIDHLNFEVKKGEIVGFLGPNGAGKTTTMRILSGYLPASSGKATVAGHDVFSDSLAARGNLGYLPETVPLYEDMVVWRYLSLMAELRKVPNRAQRVEESMARVGMLDRAESIIGKLSKGMRQRVGLAQAILHKPRVLILDEPTIGLDPVQVVGLRQVIRDLGKDAAILFSTHILSEAQSVCQRVLVINKGKIVAEDTPESLQRRVSGGERMHLAIHGSHPDLFNKLKAVKGVLAVHAQESDNKAAVLGVDIDPETDPRAGIARTVVNLGLDLLEFRPDRLSLEDIYLSLIQTDRGVQSVAPQAAAAPVAESAEA
jgi:ABC-2 type transport system ATP-binding protein